jgi:hypothetical protein
MGSAAQADEAEWATATAWFACQDIATDAGRGLRGIERAIVVHDAHWHCISGSGFRLTFKCPIRGEDVGSARVPPPACWEPVPENERQMWLEIQRELHPYAQVLR